jgi:hypothetical protein
VPGVKFLRRGQRVIFEYCKTTKGETAINVIPVKEKAEKLEKYKAKLVQKSMQES